MSYDVAVFKEFLPENHYIHKAKPLVDNEG